MWGLAHVSGFSLDHMSYSRSLRFGDSEFCSWSEMESEILEFYPFFTILALSEGPEPCLNVQSLFFNRVWSSGSPIY